MASDLLYTYKVISNPLISYVDIIFNLVICMSTPDLFYKNTKTQLGDQTRGHEDTTTKHIHLWGSSLRKIKSDSLAITSISTWTLAWQRINNTPPFTLKFHK